ncbi:MAG TPA: hypothetical protein ENJ18_18480 [Nannocystis exedens]|nr:hypothetical protein [Nannocystis exedens]
MIDAATLLARLRTDSELVDSGVDLLLDQALAEPIGELLGSPEELSIELATAIRASANSPGLAPWIEAELDRLRSDLKTDERSIAERLPKTLPDTLGRALGRPFTPDKELVRAAINHAAMRSMMRSVLQRTLLEFGKKMWSALPDTRRIPGAGFRSRLMDMAKGVASVVGSEVERQLDDRVNSFVDGTLANTIDMVIDRISDPAHSREMSAWRADSVKALLAEPQARFTAELDKITTADVATDAVALLETFASWEGLENSLRESLEHLQTVLAERSLADLLDGSGLTQAWRPLVHARLTARARMLISSDAFAAWITRVVDEKAADEDPKNHDLPQ